VSFTSYSYLVVTPTVPQLVSDSRNGGPVQLKDSRITARYAGSSVVLFSFSLIGYLSLDKPPAAAVQDPDSGSLKFSSSPNVYFEQYWSSLELESTQVG